MSGSPAQDAEYLNQRRVQRERTEAESRVDQICSELNELYRQVREKEAELNKYDRIANPQDYQ